MSTRTLSGLRNKATLFHISAKKHTSIVFTSLMIHVYLQDNWEELSDIETKNGQDSSDNEKYDEDESMDED